jgi:NADP-dependent 3-hydroxy acid dehydrogenase YdfG
VDLEAVSARLGVKTISADITDERAAKQILVEIRPEVLVLNAGATPQMGPLDELSWEDFTKPWDTDVKGGLYWLQAALNLPLATGSRVLVGSSGAAQQARRLGRLRRSQANAVVDGQIRKQDSSRRASESGFRRSFRCR